MSSFTSAKFSTFLFEIDSLAALRVVPWKAFPMAAIATGAANASALETGSSYSSTWVVRMIS